MAPNDLSTAITNRSLRTIKTELEFLCDSSVITPGQLSSILSQLPSQTQLHAPVPQSTADTGFTPPSGQLDKLALNEKSSEQDPYSDVVPPPSYASAPPVLCMASALYAYTPTDAGDLALQANDRIQVLEHMNNDWWRGRNERTSMEGIFPRTYVTIIDEKPAATPPQPTNYGNMPLEVANSGSSSQAGRKPSKFEENGKKFGKKMGNAAIFGAGATIGSNIVNGIF
ncbi:SH3 domain-containing protein [Coccidioides immitis RS]|uniref:SH3 domain-containing protein n=4 Tax=Coccidioides immitis TaxID=5501 RepID=J3K3W2_COCIM|nr:SH3 domain-containing protein [Coccidioides immitis RS]EAS28929.3 SH3 domain-containing protein [Coccidioides immitis RS]KMP06053.1 SH3 domain containing protein [Coccidioides immitis RMSCC 2394]KMU80203.1 SH3 domain containing protein, variant [Coccidioides immitis RMSCC 3703]KMU87730.1 SH3 domain-containing protein [Coccidioides immitis H538.4]